MAAEGSASSRRAEIRASLARSPRGARLVWPHHARSRRKRGPPTPSGRTSASPEHISKDPHPQHQLGLERVLNAPPPQHRRTGPSSPGPSPAPSSGPGSQSNAQALSLARAAISAASAARREAGCQCPPNPCSDILHRKPLPAPAPARPPCSPPSELTGTFCRNSPPCSLASGAQGVPCYQVRGRCRRRPKCLVLCIFPPGGVRPGLPPEGHTLEGYGFAFPPRSSPSPLHAPGPAWVKLGSCPRGSTASSRWRSACHTPINYTP
ncbi:zyxin-like [Mustela erminea]|uniref:zyxin-like n=1 Tax=Mustela erminea TaxID=36723 RepID=UPI001386AF65|nr:zyxin-like [Mustela erminea]